MSMLNHHFFPRTEPPPDFAAEIVSAFDSFVAKISTLELQKGLRSDQVLSLIRSANVEVIACIGGRGFGVRRADIQKLLLATQEKVFTRKTMAMLIDHTRLSECRTK